MHNKKQCEFSIATAFRPWIKGNNPLPGLQPLICFTCFFNYGGWKLPERFMFVIFSPGLKARAIEI
jgi:hypothetical protein